MTGELAFILMIIIIHGQMQQLHLKELIFGLVM